MERRRYEERRLASEQSDITNNENVKTSSNCWEVFFKVPDGYPQNAVAGAMKKFFLKIHNSDVICVHEPEHSIDTPKLKFLHSLVGCQFVIKTAGRDNLRKSHVLDSRQSVQADNPLMSGTQSSYHQIQIKLSEKHKRVFFVQSEEQATEIVRKMKKVAEIRDLEETYDLVDKS